MELLFALAFTALYCLTTLAGLYIVTPQRDPEGVPLKSERCTAATEELGVGQGRSEGDTEEEASPVTDRELHPDVGNTAWKAMQMREIE